MKDWQTNVLGKTVKDIVSRDRSFTMFFTDGSYLEVGAGHNDPYAVGHANLHVRLSSSAAERREK